MIIQSGSRTDIPAFYSEWFANRLKEGYVYVRNPYNMTYITKYDLNPAVVESFKRLSKFAGVDSMGWRYRYVQYLPSFVQVLLFIW